MEEEKRVISVQKHDITPSPTSAQDVKVTQDVVQATPDCCRCKCRCRCHTVEQSTMLGFSLVVFGVCLCTGGVVLFRHKDQKENADSYAVAQANATQQSEQGESKQRELARACEQAWTSLGEDKCEWSSLPHKDWILHNMKYWTTPGSLLRLINYEAGYGDYKTHKLWVNGVEKTLLLPNTTRCHNLLNTTQILTKCSFSSNPPKQVVPPLTTVALHSAFEGIVIELFKGQMTSGGSILFAFGVASFGVGVALLCKVPFAQIATAASWYFQRK